MEICSNICSLRDAPLSCPFSVSALAAGSKLLVSKQMPDTVYAKVRQGTISEILLLLQNENGLIKQIRKLLYSVKLNRVNRIMQNFNAQRDFICHKTAIQSQIKNCVFRVPKNEANHIFNGALKNKRQFIASFFSLSRNCIFGIDIK